MAKENVFINKLANELLKTGKRFIGEALRTKEYQHRTGNLYDSYGAAVYYKGQLIRFYAPSPKSEKEHKSGKRGAEEIKNFLQNQHKPASNSLVLTVAVAMFYGSILENRIQYKYKVITQIDSLVRNASEKIGATIYSFGINKNE